MKLASWHTDLTLAIWLTQHWFMYQGMGISWHKTRKDSSEACMRLGIDGLSHKNNFFEHQVQQYTLLDEACILLHNDLPCCAGIVKAVFSTSVSRKIEKQTSRIFSTCYPFATRSARLAALPLWWHRMYSTWHLRARDAHLPTSSQIRSVWHAYLRGSCITLSILIPSRCMKTKKLYLSTLLRSSVPSVPLYCT